MELEGSGDSLVIEPWSFGFLTYKSVRLAANVLSGRKDQTCVIHGILQQL